MDRAPERRAGTSVDYSAAAIDRRLRGMAELWRLGLSLARARPLGKLARAEAHPPHDPSRLDPPLREP